MSNEIDEKLLSNLFKQVRLGYTKVNLRGRECFVKHSSIDDIDQMDESYSHFLLKSKKMGVMREKEIFELLDKEGIWTKEDDDDLLKKSNELDNLKKTLSSLILEKEKTQIVKRIKEIEESTLSKKREKASLVKNTAEKYAERKSNEQFIINCLFKDKELKEEFFSQQEFDELDSSDLSEVYSMYNDSVKIFSEKNLKQLSISGVFFSMYSLYSKDLSNFFKKHPMELTFYQINLLNYAKMFTSIFENHEIPNDVRDSAEKILKHLKDAKDAKNKVEKISNKAKNSDGFSFAKATDKDLKKMGVDKRGTRDIHDIAEEKGGELNMDDFMKMHKK